MFNVDKSYCDTHDSLVKGVRVTSLISRSKPTFMRWNNVSTKKLMFICAGRGLVRRGPDDL